MHALGYWIRSTKFIGAFFQYLVMYLQPECFKSQPYSRTRRKISFSKLCLKIKGGSQLLSTCVLQTCSTPAGYKRCCLVKYCCLSTTHTKRNPSFWTANASSLRLAVSHELVKLCTSVSYPLCQSAACGTGLAILLTSSAHK